MNILQQNINNFLFKKHTFNLYSITKLFNCYIKLKKAEAINLHDTVNRHNQNQRKIDLIAIYVATSGRSGNCSNDFIKQTSCFRLHSFRFFHEAF